MSLRLLLAALLLSTPAHAHITYSSVPYGAEDAVIAGRIVEDFEDTALIPGLSITFQGTGVAPDQLVYPGALPHVWDPTTASAMPPLGGPFFGNTWDGQYALTNNGHGPGITGLSPGNGNFWDLNGAVSTTFTFATPVRFFGVGLSNFQSLGGPVSVTDHELLVNGVAVGLIESVPFWAPGGDSRNGYLTVTADPGELISSVSIRNISAADGLVFDKLAVSPSVPLREAFDWSDITLSGSYPSYSFENATLGTVTITYSLGAEYEGISTEAAPDHTLVLGNTGGETMTLQWSNPVPMLDIPLWDIDSNLNSPSANEYVNVVTDALVVPLQIHPTDLWDPALVRLTSGGTVDSNSDPDNYSVLRLQNPLGITSIMFDWHIEPQTGIMGLGDLDVFSVWSDLGGGTVGVTGQPTLAGSGTLVGGTQVAISLKQAPANARMLAWVSFSSTPFPALGGTVHAFPPASQVLVFSDAAGQFSGSTTWPSGMPSGTEVYFQFVVQDLSTVHGRTLSNGLLGTTP